MSSLDCNDGVIGSLISCGERPVVSRRLSSSPVEFMMWSTRCVKPGGAW